MTARNPTRRLGFTRPELRRLGVFYGVIAALHVAGWGLFLYWGSRGGPVYAGAGALAYSFGLRHAFDADHISAVDDSTRLLMQRGKEPLGTGFFFSLGHSSVVIALAVGLATAAESVQRHIPTLQRIGGTVGATVSGTFLMVIAFLDFLILRGVIDVWRKAKTGEYQPETLDDLMSQRGYMNRLLGSRWRRFLQDSWQMYPIGVLFGLGFDTASEVGLLALTAAAATGKHHTGGHIGFFGILALPLLFTAGMTLMDTTDGIFMAKAYGWAFADPIRKLYYNLSTVALGVFVAGGIGTVEYLQVISTHTHLHGPFWSWLNGLNFELLGYVIVGAFIAFWVASVAWYKIRRIDERYGSAVRAVAATVTVGPGPASIEPPWRAADPPPSSTRQPASVGASGRS
jgi:nickel/cobalt transporter (NiCoT) family protein